MKKEYYTELVDESVPCVKIVQVDELFTTGDFTRNHMLAIYANILRVVKTDEYAVEYLNNLIDCNCEEILKSLNLKEECPEYISAEFLKEHLHSPIAVNIPYGKTEWIIVLGFQQTGFSHNDTIILFDVDTGKIFLQNLNSFLWMCENVKVIYRR